MGWISLPALITWADSLITEQESPDPALIEISMCGSQKAFSLHSYLHAIRGSLRPDVPAKMLLAYAGLEHEAGQKASTEIAQALFELFYYDEQERILPQHITKAILDFDHLLSLGIYLSSVIPEATDPSMIAQLRAELAGIQHQIDPKLSDILNWGSEYRDKLPPQCFPAESES
jgi:hypothetical protein